MREVYELTPRILRKVLRPVSSGIAKRGTGQSSQEACPWNSFAELTGEAAFLPRAGVDGASLIELMGLTQEELSRRFRGSPVKRTKRRRLLRNVAVALGNWGSPGAVPVLAAALADEEPLVRGHAAWALGRIASREGCPPEVASHREVLGCVGCAPERDDQFSPGRGVFADHADRRSQAMLWEQANSSPFAISARTSLSFRPGCTTCAWFGSLTFSPYRLSGPATLSRTAASAFAVSVPSS